MTENKRYSFNWERGHPNFWDNHCDLADCYLTCEDVVDRLNELHEENQKLKEANQDLQYKIGEVTNLLHKEIKTSKNAFYGLMQENKELRQKIAQLKKYR